MSKDLAIARGSPVVVADQPVPGQSTFGFPITEKTAAVLFLATSRNAGSEVSHVYHCVAGMTAEN
jgi:hypothetical protein